MLSKTGSEGESPFRLTPAHTITGMSLLLLVLVALSRLVLYELRPFVSPLGSVAVLGQVLFFLLILALPAAFPLNRLPRFSREGSARALTFQPTSINLIVGAAILLIILMMVSGLLLEMTACSIGVPNCD